MKQLWQITVVVVGLIIGCQGALSNHREGRASLRTLPEEAFNAISGAFFFLPRQDNSTESTTEAAEDTMTSTPPAPEDITACRSDFFQVGESCFYVSRNLMARNWVEAQIACMEINSTLASITNMEELQSIQSNCSYIGKFFLGGTDSGSENNWKWTSGADWEFENWKSGEPNGGGRENCMEMEASGLGLWNDIDCSGFAGRCNEVGHTACNHRPSAEPKRYVCGYSMKQEETPAEETQDCGIWTVKDVDNLAAEEEAARPAFELPFIHALGREKMEGRGRRRRKKNQSRNL